MHRELRAIGRGVPQSVLSQSRPIERPCEPAGSAFERYGWCAELLRWASLLYDEQSEGRNGRRAVVCGYRRCRVRPAFPNYGIR